MAKIKHTKTELKAQRESFARFTRFLPMLQLKKQQLQAEVQRIEAEAAKCRETAHRLRTDIKPWIRLLSEPIAFEEWIEIAAIRVADGNIAGVPIPVFEGVDIAVIPYDLLMTPPWVDAAIEWTARLIELEIEAAILDEQAVRIAQELRVTTQRVNLFEKVKIPECKDNIRVIRIALGDQQTAGVTRAKIAKSRSTA